MDGNCRPFFFALPITAFSQPGINEFYSATGEMHRWYFSLSDLVLVIGTISGILGGLRIYTNWQSGKHHHIDAQIMGLAVFLPLPHPCRCLPQSPLRDQLTPFFISFNFLFQMTVKTKKLFACLATIPRRNKHAFGTDSRRNFRNRRSNLLADNLRRPPSPH
jgi:hypothetical protein